ncbi:CoA transferase [Rhizobiales bacterium]|uniref:CaiB/BaiF CoA transferase family protein n=1 Tax=Hongsoonwoonella zoysiae TaxID=2821844 RepID=UPI0015610A19|nr:CoA transferase [Hongsoonwoonella zoysiae]NRG18823.1 CoA transferase [Hongsoonwoonella zoysiae]
MTARPLAGIKVLDFTTLLPGPLATLILAEAGAEVTKIERPGGEDLRRYPPFIGQTSAAFALLNRGKACQEVDLKDPVAREVLIPLVKEADILVEQFRPGVMERLGLGFEELKAINPGLIYCSITGYGQTGIRAGEAGHDINYLALTGLLALSYGSSDCPVLPPTQIADIGGGSFPAVMNILLALLQRERTGEGARIDIAMADAMFTFALFAHAELAAKGKVPPNGQALLTGGSPRYQLYFTSDGEAIAVGALEQKFWIAFCDAIGLPEDLRSDTVDPAATEAAVRALVSRRTRAEWEPILAKADCCATPVKTLAEAMNDPHFLERGLFDHEIAGLTKAVAAAVVPIDPRFRERSGSGSS